MGSMPYRMCGVCKKKSELIGGLVDKISSAFELRNSGRGHVRGATWLGFMRSGNIKGCSGLLVISY
jgi:hypothetical protein